MIKKILYTLDKYIDINILRKVLHKYRYIIFKIKSVINLPLISEVQKKKMKSS